MFNKIITAMTVLSFIATAIAVLLGVGSIEAGRFGLAWLFILLTIVFGFIFVVFGKTMEFYDNN